MLSAERIASAVRAGDLAPTAAAERSVAALRRAEPELRATISVAVDLPDPERVPRGRLAGVPVLVKDVIDVEGMPVTRGSAIFRDRMPAETAESVRRLEAEGAIVVGKANLHEFAWGLTSTNPHWGDVVNPRDPSRTPGGSSGGNAAAVAAGLVPVGIGTDTAGSLRIPAYCCDVVGFKPARGSVPTEGVFPLAPSLDCVGPLAASVGDAALLLAVLSGRDVFIPDPDPRALRIAVADEPSRSLLAAAGLQPVDRAEPVPPPSADALLLGEAWRTHQQLFSEAADRYDPNVAAKLRAAARVTDAEVGLARRAIARWADQTAATRDYDVLVGRVSDLPVPDAGVDELAVRAEFGRRTRWVNLLGWAAIAVGGIQIVGPDEGAVIAVARVVEPVSPVRPVLPS